MYNISYETYERRSQEIGERIRTERKKLDLTQDGLAEKIDIGSRQTIAQWENGVALPPLSKLLCMCDLFGCEIGDLLCDYDCKTRTATDIQKETGLSEAAIARIGSSTSGSGVRLYTKQRDLERKALNYVIEFNGGDMLELIANYLIKEEKPVELEDGRVLTPETIATSNLLELSGEMQALRKKLRGGAENGQH